MRKVLMIMDVKEFGSLDHPDIPKLGIDLSQNLIHTYLVSYSRWGMGRLEDCNDFESFAATVLESCDGFHRLSENEKDLLLYESIHYLQTFIDYVESHLVGKRIDVFPPARSHRRLVLLVG